MPLKMFPAVSVVLLCFAGLVFGQNQLIDDLNDGDSTNELGYSWYYYDDNAGVGYYDRPQEAPTTTPSVINVPYTEVERHAFGDPDDHYLIKKYSFVTGIDALSNKFATMPFTFGDTYETSAGWDMYSFVGISTDLAPAGSSINLSGVNKIRFKIRSRKGPLSFNFKVQTFEIDSISSGDAETLQREDNNPFGYYGVWEIQTTTSFSEFEITINGGSNGRGDLTAPPWAKKALPYNSGRVTKLTWEINSDENSTVTTDTLDIDDIYFDNSPAVSLISPVDAAINVPLNPMLRWSNSANTYANKVLVSTVSDFSSIFREMNFTSATSSATLTGLGENTTYYWKVKATNRAGDSAWTPSRSFTTQPPPPSAPILVYPSTNALDVPISFVYKWNRVPDATSYDLQVATDNAFKQLSFTRTINGDTILNNAPSLSNAVKYYWQVRSKNTYGTGNWSQIDSFTTINQPPSVPLLSSPANLAANIIIPSSLSWFTTDGALTYNVQVATDAAFLSGNIVWEITGLTTLTTSVSALNEHTTYYWRVSATNGAGTSNWSTIRQFTTDISVPNAPTLFFPNDNTSDIPVTTQLIWYQLSNATSYNIQVSAEPGFKDLKINQSGLTDTTFTATTQLLNGRKYYWKVQGVNSAGAGTFSSVRTFITEYVLPVAPTLDAPTPNAVNVSPAPTLRWTTDTAIGTTFEIEVSKSNSFSSPEYSSPSLRSFSFPLSGLDENTMYHWRVRAANAAGTGPWAQDSFTTYQSILLGDFENGHYGSSIGTSWYIYNDSGSGGNSVINNADPQNGQFMGGYTPGNTSTYAGITDFKLNNNISNPYVGFGIDLTTNHSSIDLSTVTAIQFDVKSSKSLNIGFQHIQSDITDYNYYRQVISSKDGWMTVTILLNSDPGNLHQESWGIPKSLDLSKTVGFEWLITAANNSNNNQLDAVLSIDNVRLIGTCSALHNPYPPMVHLPKWKAQNVPFSTVRFEWFPITGADSYTFEYATDSLFTTDLISAPAITDTAYTATSLKADTRYYWRVKTIDGALESNWSYIANFPTAPAPNAPGHLSPLDDTTDISLSPTLKWQNCSGAQSYHVQVAITPAFTAPLTIDQESITNDSLNLSSLSRSTTYYWQVRAKYSTGYSIWSTPWKFTTIPPAPSKVTLVAPRKDSMNTPASLQLVWNTVSGASRYILQVSRAADFSTFDVNQENVTDTLFTLTPTVSGTQYFWRTAAANAGGTGEWSDTSNFTTLPAVPQTPVISAPTNGATGTATTVTIQWNTVNNASSYDVAISGVADFSAEIVAAETVTSPSYLLSGLSNNKSYYIRVCAKNVAGTSIWSTTISFTTALPAPSIPEIVAPANNATAITVPTSLVWKKNPEASGYTLQIATNEDFTTIVKDIPTCTDTFLSISTLAYGTSYYWHVKAYNAGGASDWTSPSRFTTVEATPGIPALAAPANNAGNVTISPSLVWNKSLGATSFALQIATNADFTTKIKDSTGITDTLLSIGTLQNNTVYFWKVKAINTWGESDWSTAGSFTTIIAAASAPDVVTPSNNSADITVPVSFVWHKSATATSYEITVATDEGFSSVAKNITSITDTFTTINTLLNGTTYFWKVKAVNIGGENWSTPARFTTILTAPGTPELVSPSDNSTDLGTSVSLTWKKTPIATTYSLQVSTDDAFNTLVKDSIGIIDTTINLVSLNNSTTYYWKIKAINNGGTSDWSAVGRFSTIIATPEAPEISSPLDNSTNVPVAHSLVWKKCLSAATYSIQLSKDNSFSTIVLDSAGIIDTTLHFTGLTNSTDYYWHVKATNAGGGSSWSASAKFTTIIAAPAAPVVQLPSGGTTNVSIDLSLTWNISPLSTGYAIQIAADSLFTSLLVDSTGLTDTVLALKNAANDTKYFWRVKALNTGGQSEWSTVASFTTIVALPSKVVINVASYHDTVNVDSTILSWLCASPKITRYQMEFSTDSTMSTVQVDSACADTFKLFKNLTNGTTYWWRVRAGNAAGWGEYSEKQKLKVILPVVAVLPSQFKVTSFSARAGNKGLQYALPEPCKVSMSIYNIQGVLIAKVQDKSQPAGIHFMKMPELPSGTYYISFKAGKYSYAGKMIPLK